jgi:hypothetical protein
LDLSFGFGNISYIDIPSAVLKIHGVAKLLIDINKVQCDIVSSVPQSACIYQCKASDSHLGLPFMTPNGHLPNSGLAKALAIWAERTINRKEAESGRVQWIITNTIRYLNLPFKLLKLN